MTHPDELSEPPDRSFDESDLEAAADRIADAFFAGERETLIEILRRGDIAKFAELAEKFERALIDDCEEMRAGGYRDPDE